ncbi:tRNA-binding domain protein, putative, partial [Rhizoctonia solani AG-3 Rhs1AP]
MSTAALEKLSPKAREIVDKTSLGNASSSEGEINKWIERVGGGEFDGENGLSALDTEISSRTYLVANSVSPADLALYATLHPTLSALPTQTHYTRPSLTRYIDHIQNLPALRASSVAPQLIDFKIDEAPKPERKAPPAKEKKPKAEGAPAAGDDKKKAKDDKKKEKGPAPVDPPAATAPGDASFAEVAAPAGKKEKAPKGEGKKGGEGKKDKPAGEKKPAAAAADSGDPVPSMIDLRVGKIVHVEKHPDADGFKSTWGEPEGPRTVVSGLVNYIPIEQMRDRSLIAVCNLKPASMRGVKSFAMVLCATHKDGKDHGIEIVNPPEGSKPGDRVYFEGEKFAGAQPLSQLNPKKKIFETIQPGFTTLESRECAWVDPVTKSVHRIVSERGACAAPSFVGASLS